MRKLLIIMLVLAAAFSIGYAVAHIPLGEKTLWQHMKAIWRTEEALDMRKDIADYGQHLRRQWNESDTRRQDSNEADQADKRTDRLQGDDRNELQRLIQRKNTNAR